MVKIARFLLISTKTLRHDKKKDGTEDTEGKKGGKHPDELNCGLLG